MKRLLRNVFLSLVGDSFFYTILYKLRVRQLLHTDNVFSRTIIGHLNDVNKTPNDIVIDVGANIGYVGQYFQLKTAATVVCMEPFPLNFARLVRNVHRNKKIIPLPLGASSSNRIAYMSLPETDPLASPALASVSEQGRLVPLVTLDYVIGHFEKSFSKVSLIKIDVEGHEAEVLRGARQVVELHRPVILLEYTDTKSLRDIEGFFRELKYSIIYIGKEPRALRAGFSIPGDYLCSPTSAGVT